MKKETKTPNAFTIKPDLTEFRKVTKHMVSVTKSGVKAAKNVKTAGPGHYGLTKRNNATAK